MVLHPDGSDIVGSTEEVHVSLGIRNVGNITSQQNMHSHHM